MKKTSTVKKAKSGTSLGMKSVKAGYDKNPGVTRADIISAAKNKAKNGAKVASKKVVAKKPIKKAQEGVKMVVDGKEYEGGAMLPEATVTASRLKNKKPKKSIGDRIESVGDALGLNRTYKPKPAKRSVHTVKYYRQHGKGKGSGMRNLIQRFNKGYYQ